MSYSIYINNPATGEPIEIDTPHHIIGGTYRMGGDTRLYLNITYNYSPFYYRPETLGVHQKVNGQETGGINGLQLLTIPAARERVLRAINNLRDEPLDEHGNPYKLSESDLDFGYTLDNYWLPHERNARNALKNLLSLLLLAPENAQIEIC